MPRVRRIVSLVGVMIFGLVGCLTVLTASGYADDGLSGVSITLSPTKDRLNLTPGEVYYGKFNIYNTGTEDFDFFVYAKPYRVIDEGYNPDFETELAHTQISRWVSFEEEEFFLKPNESVEVSYKIEVPEDVPAGGQYAAIFAETKTSDTEQAGLVASKRVGLLLYARLEGDTRESGDQVSSNIRGFYFAPPLKVSTLIENTGNVDFQARHTIGVESWFGGKEVYKDTKNYDVMPDTKRQIISTWEETPNFGFYKVSQTIEMLGETYTDTKNVLVLPLYMIVIFIVAIAIIVTIITRSIALRKSLGGGRKKGKIKLG